MSSKKVQEKQFPYFFKVSVLKSVFHNTAY